ncbi:MAG: hypothetical protein R3C56_11195 [Pirellulaceae bacterium]
MASPLDGCCHGIACALVDSRLAFPQSPVPQRSSVVETNASALRAAVDQQAGETGDDQAAELYFREDWKESPAETPVTQEHVASGNLLLRGTAQQATRSRSRITMRLRTIRGMSGRAPAPAGAGQSPCERKSRWWTCPVLVECGGEQNSRDQTCCGLS